MKALLSISHFEQARWERRLEEHRRQGRVALWPLGASAMNYLNRARVAIEEKGR